MMMLPLNDVQKVILREFFREHPTTIVFAPADIKEIADRLGFSHADYRVFLSPANKVKWGKYSIEPWVSHKPSNDDTDAAAASVGIDSTRHADVSDLEDTLGMLHSVPDAKPRKFQPKPTTNIRHIEESAARIPLPEPGFVPWGFYKEIKQIIKSGEFFPVFISGMSGTGKTVFISQACAELKREFIRVQITSETDESDLIGSWRLEDGNLVWVDGPVITAMKRGCILLIDEIDRSSSRIASLLGILEGQPVLIKKTGEIVHPETGFNIIATGNTKGRGSESGKYTFAIIVDDALLERFYINYEQNFPNEKTIHKILTAQASKGLGKNIDEKMSEFIEYLSKWVSIIYKTFENGAVEDVISIRRAVQILKIFSIFGNPSKAIELGISRFDEIEKNAFFDLFTKVSDIAITTTANDNTEEGEQ